MNTFFSKARRQEIRKFYDSAVWRALRKRQLLKQNLCQMCYSAKPRRLTIARHADHIIPWTTWREFIDPKNLQSLCPTCHMRKTFFYDVPKMIKEKRTNLNLKDI